MKQLQAIQEEFVQDIKRTESTAALEEVRIRYLGKKGLVATQFALLTNVSLEEKKTLGRKLNELKHFFAEEIATRRERLKTEELARKLHLESVDVTVQGRFTPRGREHPVNQTLRRIVSIFTSMGFGVEEGPEVESDYYNFEALNIPKDHPARDMQDTFYVSNDVVLRTHTSPVQVRVMERNRPPLRFIAPGKVYRCDADISHTPMFHQVEGLMVAEDISFAHLKGVLEAFLHQFLSPEVRVRFRPSFFPFTEPSAEVDIGCIFCEGHGCRICKSTGWIEILGAGMVHPRVFAMAGYDAQQYTGFAFGMGVERIAMLTYSIGDIRMLFQNDVRMLKQF